MTNTHNELLGPAERVEGATGPDRALDGLAHALLNPDTPWIIGSKPGRFPREPIYGTLSDFVEWLASEAGSQAADAIDAPFYTSSLDAAMTLVPEGCEWGLTTFASHEGNSDDGTWKIDKTGPCAMIHWIEPYRPMVSSRAATPALALTAACLRAHASLREGTGR